MQFAQVVTGVQKVRCDVRCLKALFVIVEELISKVPVVDNIGSIKTARRSPINGKLPQILANVASNVEQLAAIRV
jgi:hypothetical protein